MNLIKWNDFDSKLPSMFSAFDDIFGRDYFKSLASGMSMPAMNIKEHKDKFLLSLAVPGLEKDDCRVQVDNGVLTISSEKEQKKEDKGDYSRLEYNYSSFSRSFVLPENIDTDSIDAEYTNGELKVTLPKKDVAPRNSKTILIR